MEGIAWVCSAWRTAVGALAQDYGLSWIYRTTVMTKFVTVNVTRMQAVSRQR